MVHLRQQQDYMRMQAAGGASMVAATVQQASDSSGAQEAINVDTTQRDADTTWDTVMAVLHENQVTEVTEVSTERAGPEQQSQAADVAPAFGQRQCCVTRGPGDNASMQMCSRCHIVAFPAYIILFFGPWAALPVCVTQESAAGSLQFIAADMHISCIDLHTKPRFISETLWKFGKATAVLLNIACPQRLKCMYAGCNQAPSRRAGNCLPGQPGTGAPACQSANTACQTEDTACQLGPTGRNIKVLCKHHLQHKSAMHLLSWWCHVCDINKSGKSGLIKHSVPLQCQQMLRV